MMESTFYKKVTAAVEKKESLFDRHKGKYALRSMFAGAFLTMSTAGGAIAADQINQVHPVLGRFTFAFLFAWGLIYILFLNAELATSNMMYLTAGTFWKKISWHKALVILLYCTLFNLIGALIIGFLFARTSSFASLDIQSFIAGGVKARLARPSGLIILEGVLTNIFVNVAILSFLLIDNASAKMWIAISAVFLFVYLAQEHVIANFASFSIVKFSVIANQVENFGWLNIFREWTAAFIGNYIGGGLIVGLSYAWFNHNEDKYVD
ncbi:formate/nitrite transporter family protein [Streptococcus gallinaceus]|uniref:formate/nitrite transporter family protein n=1 Tax=Streptococcus gallinaceus TaxID=165758 RepID=UPI0020A20D91